MKLLLIVLALALTLTLTAYAAAQEPCGKPKVIQPNDVVINAHVENPCPTASLKLSGDLNGVSCLTVANKRCYNAYKSHGQWWFGRYNLSDKYQTVHLIEKFDCSKPNDKLPLTTFINKPGWAAGAVPIYRSKLVHGLYSVCVQ